MERQTDAGAARSLDHRLALSIAAGVLLVWLVAMAIAMRAAALPDQASGAMIAVFPPGIGENGQITAIVNAGGKPVRQTWIGAVWVVEGDAPGYAGRLRQNGALAAYGELPFSPELAGCFAYADAKLAQAFSIRP